ncbi:unnamed protein product [Caenorhabditis nigoni]
MMLLTLRQAKNSTTVGGYILCDQGCECSDDSYPNVCDKREGEKWNETRTNQTQCHNQGDRGKGKGLYATKFIEAGFFAIPFPSDHISEEKKMRRFEMYESKITPTKPNVEIKETKGKGLYVTKFIEAGSFAILFTTDHTYVLDSGNHTVFCIFL